MPVIFDTRCYPVLQKNFEMAHVSIEQPMDEKVVKTVSTFFENSKKSLLSALNNEKTDLSKVRVPILVAHLDLKEREVLEDVLKRCGDWSVLCGDRFVIVATPTCGLEDPKGTQLTYVINTGRFCPFCSMFTEQIDRKWVCNNCGRQVGCYSDCDFPLGRVATRVERKHRVETHQIMDRLWSEELMNRNSVYQELSEVLGVPRQYAHIAMIDDQLLPVVNTWAEARYKQLKEIKTKKGDSDDQSLQN